ncbi:MAG TPA: methyltransferase [Micropepsaceae bacterium]|nr:methyltransferase [Micropepsaceae bacterium]
MALDKRIPAAPPAVSILVYRLCLPWMFLKRTILSSKLKRAVMERVRGREFIVWPGVLNPVIFRAGRYLAEFLQDTPLIRVNANDPPTALDLGTGCGILAVFAAARGYNVTAVDIEPRAVSCARANAILNKLEDKIRVVEGDLFARVAGLSFDLVVFNLPFFRGIPHRPFERAWKSPDVIERCALGLPGALKPDGVALFVLSSHGEPQAMLDGMTRNGLEVERVSSRHFGVETMAIYAARHKPGDAHEERAPSHE